MTIFGAFRKVYGVYKLVSGKCNKRHNNNETNRINILCFQEGKNQKES